MSVSLRITAACALAATFMLAAMPVQAARVGSYHIFATPSYMAKTGRVPPQVGAGIMEYFGGSVFSNSHVVSVMWGPNVNATTVATIPGFTTAIVNSTFVDQMSIYDTHLKGVNGKKGTKQNIGRGTYEGQVVITPQNTSLNLSDDDIQKELKLQIKNGVLPKHNLNMLYMVYFPANVSINLEGLVSCQDFGAYHFATNDKKMKKSNIFYTVEPDCNAGFDFLTFAASHEFAEATTDNIPTPGSNPDFPQAWNTSDGYEIADLCGNSGTLTAGASSYTVTQYYLNSTSHCSTANYTSP